MKILYFGLFLIMVLGLSLVACSDNNTTDNDDTIGTIAGIVIDNSTSDPIGNVLISVGDKQVYSGADGTFQIEISVGIYQLSCSHEDYESYVYEDVTVEENEITEISISMISDVVVMPGMVLIEAANISFTMGSENGVDDESPTHDVSFTHDFWMDESEVTQLEYNTVMRASYADYFTPTWNESYGLGDEYPAYEIEWGDAVLYCNALCRMAGIDSVYIYDNILGTPGYLCELENVSADFSKNGYRLPTEAEWEYAYRGNVETDYYWSQDFDPYPANAADSTEFDSYAVWHGNSEIFGIDDADYGTHPVKNKTANSFGLYDMAGNMFEWCHDWYGAYTADSQTDPVGPENGSWHSIRGGSWANHATYLRATNRTFVSPCYYYYLLGFRTVLPKFN